MRMKYGIGDKNIGREGEEWEGLCKANMGSASQEYR